MSNNINLQKTVEIPPVSSTIDDSRHLSYTISIVGEHVNLQETVKPFSESVSIGSLAVTIFLESFLGGVTRQVDEYQKPLHFREDISAEEWKRSLKYDDHDVNKVSSEILEDFGLETNDENVEWLKSYLGQLISFYETKYKVKLTSDNRSMLRNLIVRMVHDRLCIKNLIR